MSVKTTRLAIVSIADAALSTPIYYPLQQLQSLRISGEQTHKESAHLGDTAFLQFIPAGDKVYRISLRGFSSNTSADLLLSSGFSDNTLRLIRLDTPQLQRISGQFWVTRFERSLESGGFDAIEAELRSHGNVNIVAL